MKGNKKMKLAATAATLCLAGVGLVELRARFILGLGDPLLYEADPDYEYQMKPGVYRRFGNTIAINSHGMRAGEADRFPVLLLGDSILVGTTHLDQSQIAMSLLRRDLGVEIGNISAGSWGPQNVLSYVERHGFFSAQVVVIVVNESDLLDVPTFEDVVGVKASYPATSPTFATTELVTRYRNHIVSDRTDAGSSAQAPSPPDEASQVADLAISLPAAKSFEELVVDARTHGANVFVFLHAERGHVPENQPELIKFYDIAKLQNVPAAWIHLTNGDFIDHIHPNAQGQKIAAQISEAISPFFADDSHPAG